MDYLGMYCFFLNIEIFQGSSSYYHYAFVYSSLQFWFLFIYFETLIRGINGYGWLFDSFIILKYLCHVIYFVLSSTLSDINITNITFFWLLILWYIFSHSFTCNLFVSLKWIPCRQHASESYFLSILTRATFWLECLYHSHLV